MCFFCKASYVVAYAALVNSFLMYYINLLISLAKVREIFSLASWLYIR